jgi:UDP-glucuronate 4-epimerase
MSHAYAHLFGLPTTGLRFFTVYGPFMGQAGHGDADFREGQSSLMSPIKLFYNGNMRRDFTYVDDVVESVVRLVDRPPPGNSSPPAVPDPGSSSAPWRVYNTGNNQPIELLEVVRLLEEATGKKAKRELLPMQPGDVPATYADVDDLAREVDFRPKTPISEGISRFVEWYRSYHRL